MLTREYFSTKRYIAYMTAGLRPPLDIAGALVAGGVDILEVGIPFSDPVLDGPIIQNAMQQALTNTTMTPLAVIETCQQIKTHFNIPIVLFTYYNPIKQLGERFYHAAKQAQVDAVLIVDLPLEEQGPHLALSEKYQLGHIQLLAPNTPSARIQALAATRPAFLYYACRAGTTGIQQMLPEDFASKMDDIHEHTAITATPVVAGFGISTATMARVCLQHCAGFVVGSCLVQAVLDNHSLADITHLTKTIDPRGSD